MLIRKLISLLALALALTLARPVRAANPFSLDWHAYNHPHSCVVPGLLSSSGYLYVNGLDIPTYEVADSLMWGPSHSFHQDYRALFSGTLLRSGTNKFRFHYAVQNLPACVIHDDTVRLRGPSVDRLLFQVYANGSEFEGTTTAELSLREIDPNLADSLENLKRAIRDAMDQLRALGTDADEELAELEALEAELNDLLDRGLDAISPEELDALLSQFDGLPQHVRDALVDYLSDLQANIAELREEIARIANAFEQRLNNVDGIEEGAPGFDPQDPGGFDPIETDDVPPIDIPTVIDEEPWSSTFDPYAKYADEVLAAFAPTVSGNSVVQRATFLSIHGAWVYNIRALELLLQQRATVTVAEWAAFLDAKGRVLDFLELYIDDEGWLHDSQVSPSLRAFIEFLKDLDVAYRMKLRAAALQLELNQWTGQLTERQRAILDALLVYDAIIRERMAQPAPAEQEDGFWDIVGDGLDAASERSTSIDR